MQTFKVWQEQIQPPVGNNNKLSMSFGQSNFKEHRSSHVHCKRYEGSATLIDRAHILLEIHSLLFQIHIVALPQLGTQQ
jgi:hypothetical protein